MASEIKVIWTESAKFTFAEILEFLEIKWGQKQIDDFYFLTDKIINRIRENPYQFPIYLDKRNIYRIGLWFIQMSACFFRFGQSKNEIYLLLFFDNRKRPIKF